VAGVVTFLQERPMLGDQFAELFERDEIFPLQDKMLHGLRLLSPADVTDRFVSLD
jgi:hypothetical protein